MTLRILAGAAVVVAVVVGVAPLARADGEPDLRLALESGVGLRGPATGGAGTSGFAWGLGLSSAVRLQDAHGVAMRLDRVAPVFYCASADFYAVDAGYSARGRVAGSEHVALEAAIGVGPSLMMAISREEFTGCDTFVRAPGGTSTSEMDHAGLGLWVQPTLDLRLSGFLLGLGVDYRGTAAVSGQADGVDHSLLVRLRLGIALSL